MNILREVGGELLKMFFADAWLAVGAVTVVSLAALLKRTGAVPPIITGAFLLVGCIAVLVASIVSARRQHRDR